MALSFITSIINDLTKVFSSLPVLIGVITATLLAAIAGYKKVAAAWPQKNLIG